MQHPSKHAGTQWQTMAVKAIELEQSILDQTDASFSLANHVISAHAEQSNFVFSPLSIHVLWGLIASGSSGPTRDQILGFLRFKSLEELHALFSETVSRVLADGGPVGGPVLSTANGLWVDESLNLKPDYRLIVENVYRAVCEQVDFQNKAVKVTEEVNGWARKETKGLIKEILPPGKVDPSSTRLILGNAVYFKGAWFEKFNASLTEDRDFYLLDGSSVRAPLMRSMEKQYVRCFDGFKVLGLPYKRGKDSRSFSMYIYLPDARDGVAALRERVCSESGFINSHLPRSLVTLDDFRVPKFKFDFHFEASGVMKKLGLVLPFEGNGLTEMVDSCYPLEVSSIFHKALIEVNEEGTEAAAVSMAMFKFGSSGFVERERLEFVADHPFLFVIREDTTGLVLFIGQLLNPF
ncbi:Serine protease inhibitor family protein [Perilla frutescens var. hirtella]|uniref:Serine protease inhibitor family protein n=1 Tax=Perilla frutescens var. hirtella TaxID=608512 RepID=A0AAD4P1A8_PERFH|nr:Serine protease inhibitor family protein [Perilla frutescens var. hirtella]